MDGAGAAIQRSRKYQTAKYRFSEKELEPTEVLETSVFVKF